MVRAIGRSINAICDSFVSVLNTLFLVSSSGHQYWSCPLWEGYYSVRRALFLMLKISLD